MDSNKDSNTNQDSNNNAPKVNVKQTTTDHTSTNTNNNTTNKPSKPPKPLYERILCLCFDHYVRRISDQVVKKRSTLQQWKRQRRRDVLAYKSLLHEKKSLVFNSPELEDFIEWRCALDANGIEEYVMEEYERVKQLKDKRKMRGQEGDSKGDTANTGKVMMEKESVEKDKVDIKPDVRASDLQYVDVKVQAEADVLWGRQEGAVAEKRGDVVEEDGKGSSDAAGADKDESKEGSHNQIGEEDTITEEADNANHGDGEADNVDADEEDQKKDEAEKEAEEKKQSKGGFFARFFS